MTAVEYLIKELSKSIHFHRVLNEINENSTIERDVLKEAKELEKQQIKDAYDHHRCIGNFDNGEEYFNETYKNNDNA